MIIDQEVQDTVTVNKPHVWNFYLTYGTIKPGCVTFHLKNELQQQIQPVFSYADHSVAPLRAGLESGYLKTHELC